MSDSDDVLAANLEFYRSFSARDFAIASTLFDRPTSEPSLYPALPLLSQTNCCSTAQC